MSLKVSSPSFKNNDYIPTKFSCEGRNINPSLLIENIPDSAKSLALIMDDPDAPRGTFVHWVAWNIELANEIPENIPKKHQVSSPIKMMQGKNSADQTGYMGPCPPVGHGVHHYHFKIYIVDTEINLPESAKKEDLLKAIEGHIIDQAEIVGLYKRD
ncbi:YbhB/YbcL family Raf kinase inhibitor-like protein [Petrotoga sp. 9PWA.NaAc.5.4]|uniref:YbhB/YbcL family Raf kinase inhibitor-like protein n=1 Tax=Petrotoga sp. 9PWA.NaAc.5.4 TaxID=1434328 RepID=UPI000CB30943|nr:YbhB/YbcL family Raf kinase inhibitor-like protein [Petrotoga sp. 9PWA.NaAc.5.4]PNR92476.1 hypothetical protein X924_09515 [Petrotoga sp. 9PWA.NaAc.5.4]